jgi:hypothetical protein
MADHSEYWDLLKDSPNYHEDFNYEVGSKQVVEVRTPTSHVTFHDPDDRVAFDREKYEANKLAQQRNVERIQPILPGPRGY